MLIVLVRHGETEINRDGLLQGRSDRALTDLGHTQAAALAKVLPSLGPVSITSSPLLRAQQTAAPIAEACGLELVIDSRLVELDYGDWEHSAPGDISPSEINRLRDDPTFAPPGGESLLAVRDRVESFCSEIDSGEGTMIVVSHVSPIKAAVAMTLGVGPEVAWKMRIGLASISRLEHFPEGLVLSGFNDTSHLD